MAGDPTTAAAAATAATVVNSHPTLLRRLLHLDAALSLFIHTLSLPIPRPLLKTLEISGDGRFFFPISLSRLLLKYPQDSPFLLSLLAGALLDLILVGLLKTLIRRPRPVYNKGMSLVVSIDHWSFPSGHSSRVFFAAWFVYLCSGLVSEAVVAGVFVWAVATSASRVMLGRHFVADVVAGASLGVGEAVFVNQFLKF